MKSFDDFWTKLTEDEIWWDRIKYTYSQKDHLGVAKECFVDLLAQPSRWERQDYADFRRCYQKWLSNSKTIPVKPQLQQVEVKREVSHEDQKKHEPVPKSDPRYQQYLKEWLDSLQHTTNNFKTPVLSKKEIAEEGGWVPKKKADYVPIDPHLYYLKDGISKFSGRKYKGMVTFPGFEHYNFGMVSVYADSKANAEDILRKAHRYANRKTNKL